jgi:uncharacterized RDD family membrane protein YckC
LVALALLPGELASRGCRSLLAVDRTLDVRTPESIAFSYELAGLGSRFLALVVDQTIQIGTLLVIFFGIVLALTQAPLRHAALALSTKLTQALAIALVIVVAFMVLFGYFIVFEAAWNGQTPGKKLLGLRVVRDGGYPIDFGASLIRNLIRVGEQLAGYYVLSAISALISSENKRLGDLAAGTIVVREARLAGPHAAAKLGNAHSRASYLSDDERGLIERFLQRRTTLSPNRRVELAGELAGRIRARVPPELSYLPDETLLERAVSS